MKFALTQRSCCATSSTTIACSGSSMTSTPAMTGMRNHPRPLPIRPPIRPTPQHAPPHARRVFWFETCPHEQSADAGGVQEGRALARPAHQRRGGDRGVQQNRHGACNKCFLLPWLASCPKTLLLSSLTNRTTAVSFSSTSSASGWPAPTCPSSPRLCTSPSRLQRMN
jgi:hypothetical protein